MLRVLFVDDDPNILQGIRRMLYPYLDRWELTFESDAVAAVEILGKREFDIVISDVRMPGVDGAQLLNEVSKKCPRMVRAILSGQAERTQSLDLAGSTHFYLSKPCSPKSLATVLKRVEKIINSFPDLETRQRILSLSNIPSSSTVSAGIATELENGNSSRIADLMLSDIGMTAKVLQLVSTSFLGRPSSISQVRHSAICRDMGLIAKLFHSNGFHSEFPHSFDWLDLDEVVNQSRILSNISKAIAESETDDECLVLYSSYAGWLSGAGRIVLATIYPDKYRELAEASKSLPSLAAENAHLGIDHLKAISLLLGVWGIPELITESIASSTELPVCGNEETFSPKHAFHGALLIATEAINGFGSLLDIEQIADLTAMYTHKLPTWRNIGSSVPKAQ